MTEKIIVNAEICIWKALPGKRKTRDLEKEARLIAKNEYGLNLSHIKFTNGIKNLKKENMITYEVGDYTRKYYQINPKASKNNIKILELVSDEYRVIKTIRTEASEMEIELKTFEKEGYVKRKEWVQWMINNRKKRLLARLKLLTLMKTEGYCPAFLENEISVQVDHVELALKEIHEALKKLDERLAAKNSQLIMVNILNEIDEIDKEKQKMLDAYPN